MDTEDGRYLGYYTADTDEPFDIAQPVYSDVTIYPKWEFSESEPASGGQNSSIPLWTLAPLTGMLGMLAIFFLTDWIRSRRNGGEKRGHTKSREIPSRTEI